MSDRQGIEIDYCPNCRGVWLDRGELDKIIDKATGEVSQPAQQHTRSDSRDTQHYQPQGFGQSQPARHYPQQSHGYPQPSHGYPQQGHHKKKRKGFLGELFDFD
jgi:Zn-finger nucleic acid-binding protein